MVEPGEIRVSLAGVTTVNRTRNFHKFSLETPEIYDDRYLRISAKETPIKSTDQRYRFSFQR
jgi:hypothetical protein